MGLGTVTVKLDFSQAAGPDGVIYVYVGNHGHPVSKKKLKEMFDGPSHDGGVDPIHLLRNIAIRARLAGVDLGSPAAIRAAVEGVTFNV